MHSKRATILKMFTEDNLFEVELNWKEDHVHKEFDIDIILSRGYFQSWPGQGNEWMNLADQFLETFSVFVNLNPREQSEKGHSQKLISFKNGQILQNLPYFQKCVCFLLYFFLKKTVRKNERKGQLLFAKDKYARKIGEKGIRKY